MNAQKMKAVLFIKTLMSEIELFVQNGVRLVDFIGHHEVLIVACAMVVLRFVSFLAFVFCMNIFQESKEDDLTPAHSVNIYIISCT